MPTRADLYVGTGVEAEWLGSFAFDGYPTGPIRELADCSSEKAWREGVQLMLAKRPDGTFPHEGWPWPWNNGHLTDYSYTFAEEQVLYSRFGCRWRPMSESLPEEHDDETVPFPDMTARKQTTYGRRSGLIVVTPEGIYDGD
jgi:hypothetical protein